MTKKTLEQVGNEAKVLRQKYTDAHEAADVDWEGTRNDGRAWIDNLTDLRDKGYFIDEDGDKHDIGSTFRDRHGNERPVSYSEYRADIVDRLGENALNGAWLDGRVSDALHDSKRHYQAHEGEYRELAGIEAHLAGKEIVLQQPEDPGQEIPVQVEHQ